MLLSLVLYTHTYQWALHYCTYAHVPVLLKDCVHNYRSCTKVSCGRTPCIRLGTRLLTCTFTEELQLTSTYAPNTQLGYTHLFCGAACSLAATYFSCSTFNTSSSLLTPEYDASTRWSSSRASCCAFRASAFTSSNCSEGEEGATHKVELR